MNGGYTLGSKISVIGYTSVKTQIMLGYVWYMKELVSHIDGSHRCARLDPNDGWHLIHDFPCNHVAVDIIAYKILLVDVALVLIEPLLGPQL